MWLSTGKRNLRCRLAQMKRSSLFLAYCFHWDHKKSSISSLKSNSLPLLIFQLFCIFSTYAIMPVLTIRCVLLARSQAKVNDKVMVFTTFLGTALLGMIIPFAKVLVRSSGREKLVSCIRTMFFLEERFKGMQLQVNIFKGQMPLNFESSLKDFQYSRIFCMCDP